MGYVLRFGVFELNLVTEELLKFGTPVRLPPQPFKVLALLASQAGQVVTREQIQFQVWGEETYVDFEQGMNHCIKQIRNALSDTADTPRYIETLPRRGYRFIAPVEARKLPGETPEVSLTLIESKANEPATSAAVAAEATAPNANKSNSVPLEIVDAQSPQREPSDAVVSAQPEPPPARSWRLVSVAAIVIALGVATYFVVRARVADHPVSAQPSSTATLHQRKSVAVLGFQNVSGHADAAWYSIAFSEMLRTELSAGDELRIVEGETVDRMKSDLHLPDTDSLAKDSLQKIQKMIGVDYVVLGSYTDLGKDSGERSGWTCVCRMPARAKP